MNVSLVEFLTSSYETLKDAPSRGTAVFLAVLREFYKSMTDLLKYELKLATQYANVGITRLAGRPVSGGLPSLGRR